MASFVEQATLRVVDQSSSKIRTINAELQKLFKTVNELKSKTIDIKVNDSGIKQATKDLNAFARAAARASKTPINLQVNTSSTTAATNALNRIRSQASRPIPIHFVAAGMSYDAFRRQVQLGMTRAGREAAPRSGIPRIPIPPRAPWGYEERVLTPTEHAARGRRGGGHGGGGHARLPMEAAVTGAFFGLHTANLTVQHAVLHLAHTAGEAAYEQSRQQLRTAVTSTTAQLEEAARWRQDPMHDPRRGILPWTEAEREKLVTNVRPDVGGATEEQRERNARSLQQWAERDLYPRLYAASGKKPEEAMKGIEDITKTLAFSTSEMFDAQGNMTADFKRVSDALVLASATGSFFNPQTIKTTMAGLKTGGLSMDTKDIAMLLTLSSEKGIQVGNAMFGLIKTLQGGINNKALNDQLAQAGLLTGGEWRGKGTKRHYYEGKALDEDAVARHPFEYAQKLFEKVVHDAREREHWAEKEEAMRAKAAEDGKDAQTAEDEIKKARQAFDVSAILKQVPSMRQNVANLWAEVGEQGDRLRSGVEQAGAVTSKHGIARMIDKNWAAQVDNFQTTFKNLMGTAGSSMMDTFGAGGKFKAASDYMNDAIAAPDGPQANLLKLGGSILGVGSVFGSLLNQVQPFLEMRALSGALAGGTEGALGGAALLFGQSVATFAGAAGLFAAAVGGAKMLGDYTTRKTEEAEDRRWAGMSLDELKKEQERLDWAVRDNTKRNADKDAIAVLNAALQRITDAILKREGKAPRFSGRITGAEAYPAAEDTFEAGANAFQKAAKDATEFFKKAHEATLKGAMEGAQRAQSEEWARAKSDKERERIRRKYREDDKDAAAGGPDLLPGETAAAAERQRQSREWQRARDDKERERIRKRYEKADEDMGGPDMPDFEVKPRGRRHVERVNTLQVGEVKFPPWNYPTLMPPSTVFPGKMKGGAPTPTAGELSPTPSYLTPPPMVPPTIAPPIDVSELNNSAGKLQSALDDGASKIASAGTTSGNNAATAFANGTAGVGASIGGAAAQAFIAQVSGASINVNANITNAAAKADTGTKSATVAT